jgi:hypothetical protein
MPTQVHHITAPSRGHLLEKLERAEKVRDELLDRRDTGSNLSGPYAVMLASTVKMELRKAECVILKEDPTNSGRFRVERIEDHLGRSVLGSPEELDHFVNNEGLDHPAEMIYVNAPGSDLYLGKSLHAGGGTEVELIIGRASARAGQILTASLV